MVKRGVLSRSRHAGSQEESLPLAWIPSFACRPHFSEPGEGNLRLLLILYARGRPFDKVLVV